ncbi:MAG: hypothetical protein KF819_27210 [Labilithrix sp.]|nr:hypothetical protein [Labilithrix sp.]
MAEAHCNAPVESAALEQAPLSGPLASESESIRASERARGWDALARAGLRGSLVRDGADTNVTSTALDVDGARYTAGTFVGRIALGGQILQSQGAEDIFLVKNDRSGNVVWAHAVGSTGVERAPRVTVSDESLNLVAMTTGRVDCGQGPMRVWSGDTFIVCTFGLTSGAPLSGGAFPTGAP